MFSLTGLFARLASRGRTKEQEVKMKTIQGKDGISVEEQNPDEPDQEILFWQE
jgi:hypothetical protein